MVYSLGFWVGEQVNDLNLGDSTVFDDPATQLFPMWIPPNSMFTMHSADPDHCILLRMYMQSANVVTVIMQENNNMDHVKHTGSAYPTATSPRGTHLLQTDERRFYLTLCGGFNGATTYVLRVEERVQISVGFELSFSEFFAESVPQQATIGQTIELYERTTGLEALVISMATLLSIPQSSIKVACVHAAGQPCIPLELMLAGARRRASRSTAGNHRTRLTRAVADPTVLELNISAPNSVNQTGNTSAYDENLAFLQGVASVIANISSNPALQQGIAAAINTSIATSTRSVAMGGVTAVVSAGGIAFKALIGNDAQVNNNTQGGYIALSTPFAGATTQAPTPVATTIPPGTTQPPGDASGSGAGGSPAVIGAVVGAGLLALAAISAIKYKRARKVRKAKLKICQSKPPPPKSSSLIPLALQEAVEPKAMILARDSLRVQPDNGRQSRTSTHESTKYPPRFPSSVPDVEALPGNYAHPLLPLRYIHVRVHHVFACAFAFVSVANKFHFSFAVGIPAPGRLLPSLRQSQEYPRSLETRVDPAGVTPRTSSVRGSDDPFNHDHTAA